MRPKIVGAVVALVTLTGSAAAADGPFGIAMGADPSRLGCVGGTQNGMYLCRTVPKPHVAFKRYFVRAHPSTGVCSVMGIGGEVTSSAHGTELKRAADNVRDQLVGVYGQPDESADLVEPGSSWEAPEHWMMGSLRNEVKYHFTWRGERRPIGRSLKGIALSAAAESTSVGKISILYFFENADACDAAIKKDEGSAL